MTKRSNEAAASAALGTAVALDALVGALMPQW
jgi:hypothetical protein